LRPFPVKSGCKVHPQTLTDQTSKMLAHCVKNQQATLIKP
jgi:hypothetical protein